MPPQLNRDVWKATAQPKKIAVVIAGAGSLGTYEAGVLAELTYALSTLNASLPAGEGRFVLDVLTGASAGGMNASILSRVMMYEADRRDRLYSAWVREINIDDLLEDDPRERNAILSKSSIRSIAGRHLSGAFSGAPSTASFAPDLLRLGLTLSNMNGLDYKLKTRSITMAGGGDGFLTTRFSDESLFTFDRNGSTNFDWSGLGETAIACGNFPLAFMPQALIRQDTQYHGRNPPLQTIAPLPPGKPYFPHGLAYIDGGLFDNEPMGMAINLAADADGGMPDPERLFLLIHPNITRSGHADQTGDGIGYLSDDLGLGAQIKRLLGMLMQENAVSDWVRANKVNDLTTWRDGLVEQLTQLIAGTEVVDPAPLAAGLQDLATVIARRRSPDPATYVRAGMERIARREAKAYSKLGPVGGPQTVRQQIFLLVLFILDHIADLQDKAALWLEVIGNESELPLAGSQVNGFAGFFNEEWRAYDYRRGRFDAWAAFTGTPRKMPGLLGDYPQEPVASQPSKPTGTDPDEYNADVAFWRQRLKNDSFPRVTFADIDKQRQSAFRNRLADRIKALLGISGVTGFLFDTFIKPKLDKVLGGNEG